MGRENASWRVSEATSEEIKKCGNVQSEGSDRDLKFNTYSKLSQSIRSDRVKEVLWPVIAVCRCVGEEDSPISEMMNRSGPSLGCRMVW